MQEAYSRSTMITYRLLNPAEMPAAVSLWVSVFGVEAEFFQTLLDGGDPDDFSVGAFEHGRQVSSVHVFIRWFRDRNGNPLKVGGIGSVSTLPEARAHGHSSKLLKMAIAEMENRGCIWSYLGTGVNDHYARHGWRTLSTPFFRGSLRDDLKGLQLEKSSVDEELLSRMAAIYQSYSSTRSMANARSKSLWMHSMRYRTTRSHHSVYTSTDGETTTAYLVCGVSDGCLDLIEGACLPDRDGDLGELISSCLALAAAEGIQTARYHLPEDSGVYNAFEEACTEVWSGEERSWMGRPIAGRISWPDLAALHADPRGRRSELDHF